MSSKIAKLLPLQSWNFVEDKALREVLTRDYRELRKVLRVGARKSAIVLCGSILEAMLIVKLSTPEAQEAYRTAIGRDLDLKEMPEWGLESMINIGRKLGYLDEDAQREAQVVQKFRNYIHPNKALQAMAQIDANSVASATTLLNRAIKLLKPAGGDVTPPPPSSKERFLKKLGSKCTQDEVRAAQQIIEWAERNEFQDHWSAKWTYCPRLRYDGYTYVPLKLSPDGQFQISFRNFLKKPSIFRNSQNREALRQRLNTEVLEHRIRQARIDGHCTLSLTLLADEADLNKFLAIFDWVVASIRQ